MHQLADTNTIVACVGLYFFFSPPCRLSETYQSVFTISLATCCRLSVILLSDAHGGGGGSPQWAGFSGVAPCIVPAVGAGVWQPVTAQHPGRKPNNNRGARKQVVKVVDQEPKQWPTPLWQTEGTRPSLHLKHVIVQSAFVSAVHGRRRVP